MHSYRIFLRLVLILAIATVSLSITKNANADAPVIKVTPIWHPDTQLSTIDIGTPHETDQGDDLRYVDLEIDVTTNVEFWAMELTCTVNKSVLESYTPGSDPNATEDDTPIVTWGPSWQLSNAQVVQPFNTTTGTMTIAAANLVAYPLGKNTVTTSFPVATIRYRVKPVATATTSTLACTGSFLNTNGQSVLAPVFVLPPPLKIIPAYTISGNVSYQGRTTKSGIGVTCVGRHTYRTTTDATGNFTLFTRHQDRYNCFYFGNTSVHPAQDPDLYIQGNTDVVLDNLSYKLLPVLLPGGNVDRGAGTETSIDESDLALVTFNYGKPVAAGDTDGDGKVTKSDLAIVAGNYTLSEIYRASHVLFGLTTGLITNGSRIWVSRPALTHLEQLIPGTNVDNWPALSPDGSKLVVTRRLGTDPNYRYALFIMNSDGTGAATQLTPITGTNGNYDAFAASWSPDGSQIAFNCSIVPGTGWYYDDVSLCVMDAAGHSFRVLDTHVRIFPPAWRNNSNVVYAGNSHHTVCPKILCSTSVVQAEPVNWPVLAGVGPTYVDMPIMSDGALFYRTIGSGTVSYRMAETNGDGFVLSNYPSASPPYHVALPPNGGDLDYFTVKRGGRDVIVSDQHGGAFHTYTSNGSAAWVFAGLQIFPNASRDPDWNFIPESGSYIYTQRNSFVWVP